MARKRSDKKPAAKAGRKKPQDTTVQPIPLSFDDAVKALLGTPPPGKKPEPRSNLGSGKK
jgi:hypothetical protein